MHMHISRRNPSVPAGSEDIYIHIHTSSLGPFRPKIKLIKLWVPLGVGEGSGTKRLRCGQRPKMGPGISKRYAKFWKSVGTEFVGFLKCFWGRFWGSF